MFLAGPNELWLHRTAIQNCDVLAYKQKRNHPIERRFSTVEVVTLEVVQYIGGITSVLWGDSFSTVGDSFSTVGVASVLCRCGRITSVHAGGTISTVEGNISTVEGIQCCGGSFSTVEVVQYSGGYYQIASVLWRVFSTLGG